MSDSMKSTKFIMSTVCLVMVFVSFMFDKISSEIFMQTLLGILGTYAVTNTASKFADKKSAN